jgi:iron(III) transport system ATP-binding protein
VFVSPQDRDIAMVFQTYAIWPHMNVFDNIAYPLRHGKGTHFSKDDVNERVISAMNLVRLSGLERRPATQLSGGQQQRVAIARALVRRPRLLLLDEPLSNLDAKLRDEMREELRELLKRLGTTIAYVTHDQLEAMAMSDKVALMHGGRIVQEGNPIDIYERPSGEFAAAFMGKMNFLPGRVEGTEAGNASMVVQTDVGPIHCLRPQQLELGQQVKIAVRPENVVLHSDWPGDKINLVRGTVEYLIYIGDARMARVRVGKALLAVKLSPRIDFDANASVYIEFPQDLCQVIPS